EVELGETSKRVVDLVDRLKPARLVFDSLSELGLLARDTLRYRRQILAFKRLFSERGCTALLLDDMQREGNATAIQSIAHGAIEMQHIAPEFGTSRRRLRVVKLRGVDFLGGYHDFAIRRGGLVVFPRLIAAEHDVVALGGLRSSGIAELDTL